MNKKAAGFLMVACMGAALAGGCVFTQTAGAQQVQKENQTEEIRSAESSDLKAPSADAAVIDASEEADTADGKEASFDQEETENIPEEIRDTGAQALEQTGTEEPKTAKTETQGRKGPGSIRAGHLESEGAGSSGLEMAGGSRTERAGVQKQEDGRREPAGKEDAGDRTDPRPSDVPVRKIYSPADIPPGDTVGFVPSWKEEIMEDQYIQSVVDENDPDSYQTIKKEKVIPTLYVNNAGDIKYAYEDGIWYEYKYSSVNITLGTKNEALALRILNIDGSYDDYEVVRTDCKEILKEDGSTEYEFHVRYQGMFAMDGSPMEVAHLKAGEIGRVAATRTVTVEEKVPVLMQQLVGTGKYQYYGWQVLDGGTFYFDQDGKKVTGSQVIQGIRHEFDENGVRTSRAGVEVSEDNGEIDWERVSAAGLDLALIRCAYRDAGEGRILPDSRAEENIKGAQAAGLEVVLSVFSQAVTTKEAAEEAETAVNMAKTYGLTTPIVITSAGANPEHTGRADSLKPSERTACIHAFCQTIKKYGYTPVLHAEMGWITDSLCMETLADTPLWVAEYNTNLTYTGSCDSWQYTAKGTVDGISGYTGLIISYENRRDFQ